METRKVGARAVSCIGFGGAPISLRADRPSDDDAVALVQAALDLEVTIFDTADVYTPAGTGRGHSEQIIARALRERGLDGGAGGPVLVATKGGKYWDGAGEVQTDGRPEALVASCEASLRALGVETIGLYQLHTVDPAVPIEESIGALAELRGVGKIADIGVSNVTVEQLERARSVTTVASVQNRYSPALDQLDQADQVDPVLARCEELDIAFLPWAPLTGFRSRPSDPVSPGHETLQGRFGAVAARLGISVQRLVLAWELARSRVILPIPGCTRPATLADSVAAAGVDLQPADLAQLSGLDLP